MLNELDKNMGNNEFTNKMISLSDIQTVSKQCINLLSTAEKLRSINEDAYKYAEELFPSLRKLYIASMMHDKRLICISGLQGAGKTTLMKNFYGITDSFMNVSLGRGERVPVLITEGDKPKIQAIVVREDENGNYSKDVITYEKNEIDEIIRATKGEDKTIMYVELVVPYKHTNNNGVSFMLLPGFEKNNEYWNDLIEFSVNSSDAAVFVFNETSFSNAVNEDYLRKIESKFGSNVIYAISGSDSSLDDNAQVKNTCMEVLNVKNPDRIVCVGQYNDADKNSAWIAAFKTALDKYALYETQVTRNISYIYKELLNIKNTLYNILGILNRCEEFEETDYHNHNLLKAYDKAILKQRKELARHITEEFEVAKGRSVNSVENQLVDKPWYKSLKKTFFGPNVKDYQETHQIIKSSFYDESNNCLPDLFLGYAIQKSINILDQPLNNNPNALQLLVDTEEIEDGRTALIVSEDTKAALADVRALIQVPNKNAEGLEIHSSNPNRLLKAVAEIATYYYGFSSYNSLAEKTVGLAFYEPAKSNFTGDDVIKGAESSKRFAVGLAGVMGVDILGDGTLNLVSQIATSCSLSLPIAGAAAVLIVGIGAATAVMSDINRMQREDFESAKMTVLSIYDNIQRETLERFDIFTNEVRDRIEDNLADLGRERRNTITIYNAKVEVNNLLDFLDDITKKYLTQSHGIGS